MDLRLDLIAWAESEESNHKGYGQARSESEVHRMGVILCQISRFVNKMQF